MDNPCDAFEEICREQLGPLTFQKAQMIEATLVSVTGCKAPWDRAALTLSHDDEVWTAERVRDQLDAYAYVQRRNRIAHAGDLKPGGRRTATEPIQLAYVEDAVRVVRAVGDAVVDVVAARVRSRAAQVVPIVES